jgi:beta-glucanase (GH16 family)
MLTLTGFLSCQEDEPALGELTVPENLVVNVAVAADQSGNVTVSPTADNALYFHVVFVPGDTPAVLRPGETASFRFTKSGQYTAPVTVIAFSPGGFASTKTVNLDLDVRLLIDAQTLQQLAGDGEKRWVWNKTVGGHFGVGPLTNFYPEYFSAGPNQLNPCLYDDVLVFSYDASNNYSFTLEPGTDNLVFMNWTEVKRFFPDATPAQYADECRDLTDKTAFSDDFVVIDNTDGTRTLDLGDGFMSYWAVISGQYEIMELTADRLTVRGISSPFNGDAPLAWYYTFVPESGGNSGGGGGSTDTFETLIFEEGFDVDGAPDPTVWNYDIGTGNNGWGNNESQYYTNRPENIIVDNGFLKITARREPYLGRDFTSSRIQSHQKFEFQYGRVEIRAKMPTGGGTWPALWMLGSDFQTNPWPAAGEIDIMEHIGNTQDVVYGTTHDPFNFAGNARSGSTTVPGVSEEFHIYALEWTETEIRFYVDDEQYYAVSNNSGLPFNKDFFLILNVAMGGTFGGSIDANFAESTMEVDYIRVYQ